MNEPIEIGGKQIVVRPLKAKAMLDIEEGERLQDGTLRERSPREVNRLVMAGAALLEDGSPAFKPEEIEDLSTPDYRRLLTLIWKVHNPADAKKG